MEKENMKAWNDIINCTEDQQDQMLANMTKRRKPQKDTNNSQQNDGDKTDERQTQPGFSADQCFKRIDADLKNMLKKKHIPLLGQSLYKNDPKFDF